MSDDAPAIPLFGDAYLADTRHLSLEEHGAYLQLMMIAWRSPNCALPDDDARLSRMLGITAGRWSKLKPAVMEFWTRGDNGWTQKRLSKERAYVSEKSAKNSRAAKARWEGQPIEKTHSEECERISECNAPPPPPLTSEAKASSVVSAKPRFHPSQALEIWNAMAGRAGLSKALGATGKRLSSLKSRIAEHGEAGFRQAVDAVERSKFCRGENDRGWKADIGFLLRPENFLKLIEGGYGSDHATTPSLTAEQVARTQTLQAIYDRAKRGEIPWSDFEAARANNGPEPPRSDRMSRDRGGSPRPIGDLVRQLTG